MSQCHHNFAPARGSDGYMYCPGCHGIMSHTPLAFSPRSTASHHSNAPSASHRYNAPFVNSAPSRMELRASFPLGNPGYFTPVYHEAQSSNTPLASSHGIPLSPSTASVDSFRPHSAPALASPPQIMLEEGPAATLAPPQSTRAPRARIGSEAIQESARMRRQNPDAATYPCPRPGCTATFTRRHNLKSHEKSHDGQKDYQCELCGAWFLRSYDRNRHISRSCPHSREAGPSS